MCQPLHYSVDYRINPWMKPGRVNRSQALQQWRKLAKIYRKLNIQVEVIDQEQGLPDMVFCVDQGIIHQQTILISNFLHDQRQPETDHYLDWFQVNQFHIRRLPKKVSFEGGDALFFNQILFIGTGFRTSPSAVPLIGEALNFKTVSLQLTNPRFYHLDTCLLPLNQTTAFYYPPAFSEPSLNLLKNNVPHLIILSQSEAYRFAANSVVTDHHVILPQNVPSLRRKLKNLGYKTTSTNVDQYLKSGGGIHCLTATLATKNQ